MPGGGGLFKTDVELLKCMLERQLSGVMTVEIVDGVPLLRRYV